MLQHGIGLAAGLSAAAAARGQSFKPVHDAGALGPPSNGSYFIPIIRERKLDAQHGLDLQAVLYTDPGAMYADFASHKTSIIFGAFFNGANFYVKGLPLRLLFTLSTANCAIVTRNPAITQPQHLQGKTLVATTSSGFYGLAVLFINQYGLDARSNVSVISAPPSSVQTQLLADKADAGVVWDPALSNLLAAGFHVVGDMTQGIRQELGMPAEAPVWYIGAYAWRPWIEDDPARVLAMLRVFQNAAEFYNTHG